MIFALCFFFLGFVVSFAATPYVIGLSRNGLGLDHADESRKKQGAPISRLGGMPLMLAVAIGIGVILYAEPKHASAWFPILLGSLLMYGLGLWDDIRRLGARVKLLGQFSIASLVYTLGLSIDKVSYPGGAWSVELGAASYFITVLWLIAVPNIVNLIDGFDGLAGGLGVFMSVTLGIVAIQAEQLAVAWYAFTMGGALVGFLVFNFPPAKIYLGDGGAYLIGFTIAALSLRSANKASVAAVLVVTVIAMGIPILDTTFALLRRALRGYPIFHADDEHFHHRLEKLGLSKQRIVLGVYAVMVVLCLIALSVIWSQGRTLPIGIGAIFILALAALRYFHKVRTFDDFRSRADRVLRRRRDVAYALAQAKVLEMEVERCKCSQEFWTLFECTIRRVGFTDEGEVDDQVAVTVRYNGSRPFVLYAPQAKGELHEWQRMAECFREVLVKGHERWKK